MNIKVTHQPLPSYHFEGKIAVPDDKGYVQDYLDFPFDVPEGVGALRLRLQYSPSNVDEITNLITLGLYDPHGFRGNAHRSPPDGQVVLSPVLTTPGFLPGKVIAGQWLAQLAGQVVMPSNPPCAYSLDIDLLPAAEGRRPSRPEAPAAPPPPPAVTSKAGWYRGELHSHTIHSDGKLAVQELIPGAQRMRLDFLAITDHNTISAMSQIDPAALNGLLVIPGIELTTFYGHALALGVSEWVDWRTGYQGWTMEDAARRTHELGGLFIIAHPNDVGMPVCTGCHWDDTGFDLSLVDAIEVWNNSWQHPGSGNPANLAWWQQLQSETQTTTRTLRMPATCGGDIHILDEWGTKAPFIYVYAASLSKADILDGIRQGRVMFTNGPHLSLRVSSSGDGTDSAGIGDTLHTHKGQVHIELTWENAPLGARLQIHGQQGVLVNEAMAEVGSRQLWVDVLPQGDRFWAEIYTLDGDLSAFTNPIFIAAD